MKSIIPWLLFFLLAGVSAFIFMGNRTASAEISSLTATVQQMEKNRGEIEALRLVQVDADEMGRLRNENREIYRMRNEVAQLRREKAKLSGQPEPKPAIGTSKEGIPIFQRRAEEAAPLQVACILQLQQIEEAKRSWGLQYKQQPEEALTLNDLARFFPNRAFPTCPEGGTYAINPIGKQATCSIPGHALPITR